MTKKIRLDELILNDKGGMRAMHTFRYENKSYVVYQITHLYQDRLKRWVKNYEKAEKRYRRD
jgi:hypothetical protein